MTDAYRVAYDGRPFHGFQRQPDVPTVEGALFDALRELGVADGRPEGYAAAGRTDAGVSAVAQTVAFDAPGWLAPAALNAELPPAVRAWARAGAPPDFHATRDAAGRTYRYHLHAPPDAVEDGRARGALEALRGEHDFHNLTPDGTGTVRELSGHLERDGAFLVVTLSAGGFPRQFVRRAVSLVGAVARGERDPGAVDRALEADPLPGPRGIPPAPPHPLVLAGVAYPDLDFAVGERALADTRAAFEARRAEAAARTRVAADVVDGVPGQD